jgi:peptidoglycan hydrolase-like protein with peptidoglycan-binding domain
VISRILVSPFPADVGRGTTSTNVTALQDYLVRTGYLDTEPTGYFGTMTMSAVKRYQIAHNIEGTGYVGALTRSAIQQESCNTSDLPANTSSYSTNTVSSYSIGVDCPSGYTCTPKTTGATNNTVTTASYQNTQSSQTDSGAGQTLLNSLLGSLTPSNSWPYNTTTTATTNTTGTSNTVSLASMLNVPTFSYRTKATWATDWLATSTVKQRNGLEYMTVNIPTYYDYSCGGAKSNDFSVICNNADGTKVSNPYPGEWHVYNSINYFFWDSTTWMTKKNPNTGKLFTQTEYRSALKSIQGISQAKETLNPSGEYIALDCPPEGCTIGLAGGASYNHIEKGCTNVVSFEKANEMIQSGQATASSLLTPEKLYIRSVVEHVPFTWLYKSYGTRPGAVEKGSGVQRYYSSADWLYRNPVVFGLCLDSNYVSNLPPEYNKQKILSLNAPETKIIIVPVRPVMSPSEYIAKSYTANVRYGKDLFFSRKHMNNLVQAKDTPPKEVTVTVFQFKRLMPDSPIIDALGRDKLGVQPKEIALRLAAMGYRPATVDEIMAIQPQAGEGIYGLGTLGTLGYYGFYPVTSNACPGILCEVLTSSVFPMDKVAAVKM